MNRLRRFWFTRRGTDPKPCVVAGVLLSRQRFVSPSSPRLTSAPAPASQLEPELAQAGLRASVLRETRPEVGRLCLALSDWKTMQSSKNGGYRFRWLSCAKWVLSLSIFKNSFHRSRVLHLYIVTFVTWRGQFYYDMKLESYYIESVVGMECSKSHVPVYT